MKKFLQTVRIILVMLLFFISIYFEELMDFRDLQTAGYVCVEPVRMWAPKYKNEPVYVSDYRIEFLLETESGGKYFDLNIEQAYDTEDYVKGLNAYKKKKPVEGYVYYSETTNNAYFSKTAQTSGKLIKERLQPGMIFVLIAGALFILPIWIPPLLDIFKVTKLPEGYNDNNMNIVCTYHCYTWCFLLLISALCFAMMMCIAVCVGFTKGKIILGIGFLLLAACFGGLVAYFALMIKNWLFIIDAEGILYRTPMNKVFSYRTEEILQYNLIRAYRNRSIFIKVKGRKLWLNYYCTNYYKVEEWLVEHVK